MNNGLMIVMILLVMLPTVLITTIMPMLTRRIESFGVTIPPAQQSHPLIARWRRQYMIGNGLLGVLIVLGMLLQSDTMASGSKDSFLMLIYVLGYLVVSFAYYVYFHYATKRLKATEGWSTASVSRTIVSITFRHEKLAYSSLWFIPHLLLIVMSIVIVLYGYDRFPDIIPMQYDFAGNITNSVNKSYMAVMWPAIIQTFLLLVFMLCNYIIGQGKQIVESSDPQGSLQRNVKFRRYWSAYMIVAGFLVMGLFEFFLLGLLYDWSPAVSMTIILSVVGVVIIGSIVLSVVTGQGGSRIKIDGQTANAASVPNTDQDRYWKLGQLYFNREDPSLFVEKRFGVGWTVNLARPLVWLILIAIIALPILLSNLL